MTSLVLRTATTFLIALLALFSVFLLAHGHNDPGGGFSGGLVAGAALTLYAVAHGPGPTRRALRIDPLRLVGIGILVATGSGLSGLLAGRPFMTGLWGSIPMPGGSLDIGTPLAFDLGVYLAVLGMVLTIVLSLAEE